MAYEQIAAVTGPPAIPALISFYYPIDDLFNIDSVWTMYKAIHKLDDKGADIVDRMAITEDERDIFMSLLSDGVYDIFARFLKYTKGITDAIGFNVAYTPDGGTEALSTFVKIVDHSEYNVNKLDPINRVLEKCLRFYVLKEWFSMKDMDSDAAKSEITYNNNINKLLLHSMELKRPTITY